MASMFWSFPTRWRKRFNEKEKFVMQAGIFFIAR